MTTTVYSPHSERTNSLNPVSGGRRMELELEPIEFEFEPLRHRMIDRYNWTNERYDEAFKGYKKYIQQVITTGKSVEPESADVDELWHNHILFTRDYLEFCKTYAGYFIHHEPYPRGDLRLQNGRTCGYWDRSSEEIIKDDLKD